MTIPDSVRCHPRLPRLRLRASPVLSRCCRRPALAAKQPVAHTAQRPRATTDSGVSAVGPCNSRDSSSSAGPPPPQPRQLCLTHKQHATQAVPSGSTNVQQPREQQASRSTSCVVGLGGSAGSSSPQTQQADPRVAPSEGTAGGAGGGGGCSPGIGGPSPGQRAPLLLQQHVRGPGLPPPQGPPRRASGRVTLPAPLAVDPTTCTTVAEDDVEASTLHRTTSATDTVSEPAAGSEAATAYTTTTAGRTFQLPPSPGPTTPPSTIAASRPAPVTPSPAHPPHPSLQRHPTHSCRHAATPATAHAHAPEMLTLSCSGIPGVPNAGPLEAALPDAAAFPAAPYGGSQLQQKPERPAQDSSRLDPQGSSGGVSSPSWSAAQHSGFLAPERVAVPAAGTRAGASCAATGPAPQTPAAIPTAAVTHPEHAQALVIQPPSLLQPLQQPPPPPQHQQQQQEVAAPVDVSFAQGWLPSASGRGPAVQAQPQRRVSRQTQPRQGQADATGLLPVSDTSLELQSSDVEDDEDRYGGSVAGRDGGGQGSDADESAGSSGIEHASDGGGGAAVAAAAAASDGGGRVRGWSLQHAVTRVRGDVQQHEHQQLHQQQQREGAWQLSAAVSSGAAGLLMRRSVLVQVQASPDGQEEGNTATGSAVLGSAAAGRTPETRSAGLGLAGPDAVGAAVERLRRSEFTFGEPRAKWRRASAAATRDPRRHIVTPYATTNGSSTSSVGEPRNSAATAAAMTQSEASGRPLRPRPAVCAASTPSGSAPPSGSALGADQAPLQPFSGEDEVAVPADLVPSASHAVCMEPPSRPVAEQQAPPVPLQQQRQPSSTSSPEPTTPFGTTAGAHYYQSLVRQEAWGTGRSGCEVAPLALPPPPGIVLPLALALPPGGRGSTSESRSSGPSPMHPGPWEARRPNARRDSSVSPAHPFRLTLLPCKPGSEVDNLLSLAANISQAPIVMAAALLPGTFYVKLNRNMIAAAIAAAGNCPDAAAAAASIKLPAGASRSTPAASSPASPASASHQGSAAAAGAATGATCRPVVPSTRAAGQSVAAAVAGARTAAQVMDDVEWQLRLGSWVVSASLEAADRRPPGGGSTTRVRGHGGRARAAGGGGLGSGADAEAEAEAETETDDSLEWAEVKGGCDLNMVVVEDAVVDTRTRNEAFARMAPPIRFVLAVPLETADSEEATSSVGSSGRIPTEVVGLVKGSGHVPEAAPMPRLLGALCLADFKRRPASSICRPLLDNVRRLLLSHLGRDVQMYDERQKAKAVLAELVGSLQRLLDRYDTAVLLANLPSAGAAGGHTAGSCKAGGGAGAGPAARELGAAVVGREPRWPVLYVNNAWTALTGLKRDDVLGRDLRDLITTAAAQPTPQPSDATLPPQIASGASLQGGAGRSANDHVQGPGPTIHPLGAPARPGPLATAAPSIPASATLCHVPIPWAQHQVTAAARGDIVLHNVVLPAAAGAAEAGPGVTGGGFVPRGPLATLHFRFVAREMHEESGLLPAGWQSLLGTIREDGWRAFGLVTPEPTQPPSRSWSALGAPDEATEASSSYAAALSQHCTSKVPGLDLSHLLGKGGYGSVYRGTWHGTPVAVKMIDVSGSGLSVECASLEAVMGQALDHPHIVKTLMFLARGRDGHMVQFGGGGGTQGFPHSPASGSGTIGDFLHQMGSADQVGGGRGRRPTGQPLGLATASSIMASASVRSRLSLPGGPAVDQGGTGLGWMEGSMASVAAAQRREETTGDPRGEGTAGGGQAAGPRSVASADSCTGYQTLTLRSSSDHWSSSSAWLSAGLQRGGNVSWAGSGGGGDGGGGGGTVDALHAHSHASSTASLPAGVGALGTNRSGGDAPAGGTVAPGAGFLPTGRGGIQLEAVPEAASPSSDTTSSPGSSGALQQDAGAASPSSDTTSDTRSSPGSSGYGSSGAQQQGAQQQGAQQQGAQQQGAQQQDAIAVGAAGTAADEEALFTSPFFSEQHFAERTGAGTGSATHYTHAHDPFTVTTGAMLTSLQQQQQVASIATGVGDALSAERRAHVPLASGSRPGVGRLGGGGSNVHSTGDSSTMGGSGGAGGSSEQLSMTSSQVAAAVRLTSTSGMWRQRQGSAATSEAAALSYGALLASGSRSASTWQSGTGSGAGPATSGSEDTGMALVASGGSRTSGRRGRAGATGRVTPGRPKQQQRRQQGPASVSGDQVLSQQPKGSGRSSAASAGSHPSALTTPHPQQQHSHSTTPTSPYAPPPRATAAHPAGTPGDLRARVLLGTPEGRTARARAPAGARGPAAKDLASADDSDAAAAREGHRQALMLLSARASSTTAAGTPNTSSSHAVSLTSPKPPPSSVGLAPQTHHQSNQQQPQSQPPRSPQPRLQLQHAGVMTQGAIGASRAPVGTASSSAFAVASQRRLSSDPFTGPGLAPRGHAAVGTRPNQPGAALATSPSAPTASTDAAPVGFPGTAAEASALRHSGRADVESRHHSHQAGGAGSSVPWEVLRQEHDQAGRQEEEETVEEEEEFLGGIGGGSFSDVDSESELMGTDILDSPRTAARVAREARKGSTATSAAVAMAAAAAAAADPSVGCALGPLGHSGGARAEAGAGATGQGSTHMGDAGSAVVGSGTAGDVSEVWIVMEYCDMDTLQLALERGLFALPPEPSLASSAGPPAVHALAAFPSLASSGAASRPFTGGRSSSSSSSSSAAMSQSGATAAGGPTGRHGHVSAVRRVDMRALVATALEVASALRYLHDLGIVHGDLTARNVMLVSLERAHGHAHGQGVDLPSSPARIPSPSPSPSPSHVPAQAPCQLPGEPAGATPRSRTRGGAGRPSRGPLAHRHADACGPLHVCTVRPSAARYRMISTVTTHTSSTSTSTATSAASGGRGAGSSSSSGSAGVRTVASGASVELNSGSGAGLRAGMLAGRDAGQGERPLLGAGSVTSVGARPCSTVCGGCGRCFVAKVADFGLSRMLDTQSKILTKTVGTLTSMPPETLLSGTVSKAADVYAYGVLVWHMYTGQRPWSGMNHGQIVYNVGMKGQQLPFPPDTPHGLLALSRACTRSAARDRPTFAQLQHQLAQLAIEQGLPLA